MTPTYTIQITSEVVGLKPAMIHYLVRMKVVIPKGNTRGRGRGTPLKFTFADLLLLRTIKNLLEQGISVSRLSDALKALRKRFPRTHAEDLFQRYLITDGKNAYFRTKDGLLQEIGRSEQMAFSFIIDMAHVRKEVLTALEKAS